MSIANSYPLHHFEENMKINETNFLLSFSEIYTPSGNRYFIKAENERKKCFVFEMIKDEYSNHWRIIEPSLQWLKGIEDKLSEVILNHD